MGTTESMIGTYNITLRNKSTHLKYTYMYTVYIIAKFMEISHTIIPILLYGNNYVA